MKFTKVTPESHYILKLEIGDDVHGSILDFCQKEGVKTGWITGLGAITDISLGYYNLGTKKYQFTEYTAIYEVMGLIGNIALVDGQPFLHIHTSISDDTNSTQSGHLQKAKVAVTLEIQITSYKESVSRLFEDAVGLRLLQCGENNTESI